jgi:hypothetical protein
MRNGFLPVIVGLALSAVLSARAAPNGTDQLSGILARMKDRDLHAHITAFYDLLNYASSAGANGAQPRGSSDALNSFLVRHPEKADQVKLSLIELLKEENHSFIEVKNPPPDSHDEDDVGEYYAELVDTVSSLNDERAVPALIGAMTTGGMAQRGILKYGDKALQPVLEQLKSSDALARASALGMATAILEGKSDPAAHALVLNLLRSSLKDPGAVVRRHAVRQIDCLAERQDFAPLLEEIAKTDPDKLPGRALDGGDGGQFYPVRADARRALRHIQNNQTCGEP